MGGVHNGWKKGYTFDFVLGRELKISDIFCENEEQLKTILANKFYDWLESETEIANELFNANKERILEQSGLDANFYLAEDGVHVFYEPYTIPATQNGIDILIPYVYSNEESAVIAANDASDNGQITQTQKPLAIPQTGDKRVFDLWLYLIIISSFSFIGLGVYKYTALKVSR